MPRPLELKRSLSSVDTADATTIAGYGAVFNNVDTYGDMIAKGAFKDTLEDWRRRGSLPKMLLQHGGIFGSAEDGIPVGQWTEMQEDDTGLFVSGRLFAPDTDKGKFILEGLKCGALDGLSIGFIARDFSYAKTASDPKRTLKRVDLFEVSIVTFPANPEARVRTVAAGEKAQWAQTARKIERLTSSIHAATQGHRSSAVASLADSARRLESSIRAETLRTHCDTLRHRLHQLER